MESCMGPSCLIDQYMAWTRRLLSRFKLFPGEISSAYRHTVKGFWIVGLSFTSICWTALANLGHSEQACQSIACGEMKSTDTASPFSPTKVNCCINLPYGVFVSNAVSRDRLIDVLLVPVVASSSRLLLQTVRTSSNALWLMNDLRPNCDRSIACHMRCEQCPAHACQCEQLPCSSVKPW